MKNLEKKVYELEDRLKKIEDKIAWPSYADEKDFMGALYKKAKELVVKHNKTSAIFLQKKLIIDYARAVKLLDQLRTNGVIKPESGF